MKFSEKLDFLMNITKTTNSALSLHTKIDASHISRLRRGQRGALKDMDCIYTMASYFSRHCEEEYQKKTVNDALNIIPSDSDSGKLSTLIAKWLSKDIRNEAKTVGTFLSGFSSNTSKQPLQHFEIQNKIPMKNDPAVSIFYGIEGKRKAVINFLTDVLAQSLPNTLLLFSDEATDWITEDREFTIKWVSLMFQVLEKGNKIKIIHTISRDLDEMLNAISQWMPLYMTGAIEAYFYPKKRDGIFKQTMFIAPNVSAVISRSVGNMITKAANLFFKDKSAIKAFEEEYEQYLSLCKPLMRIYTSSDQEACFDTLLEFEKVKSNSIVKTESLSFLTMPETVLSSIVSRMGEKGRDLIKFHKQRTFLFETYLISNSFSEIILLPHFDIVIASKLKVASSDMLIGGAAYYTPEEYLLHLEHLVDLWLTYDNFHVYLSTDITEDRYMVYAKEDLGAIVAKTSTPPVVLAMNEPNMTAAFWDFLKHIIGENAYRNPNNTETSKKLIDYVKQIKQTIHN